MEDDYDATAITAQHDDADLVSPIDDEVEEVDAAMEDDVVDPTSVEVQQKVEENGTTRGLKRPLDTDENEGAEDDFIAKPTSTSKCLPLGITVSWKDNSDLVATFSTHEQHETQQPDAIISETQLCIVGRAKIRCLEGSVELLGHVLTAAESSKETSISSPFWSSWMTIAPVPSNSTASKIQISSIRGSPSFRLAPLSRPTVIPPSWRTSVETICDDFSRAAPPSRDDLGDDAPFVHANQIVLICGAKGVGKSTLLRYATNRLLQSYPSNHLAVPAVAILDADVGQPELAPPGMLRLSLQRRPLLHPPYWNLCHAMDEEPVEQISAIYYGAVTSKVDPTRYIESIQRLVQDYHEYLANSDVTIPLLINLDGWIKGMGFEILKTIITSVKPAHICQILGESKGKSFDLSDVVVNDGNDNGEATFGIAVTGAIHAKLFYLDACTKHVTPCSIPATTLRTIRFASYFGPHLVELWDMLDFMPAKQLQTGWHGDDECSLAQYLAEERPYCVPMETVQCIHCNSSIMADFNPDQASRQILQSLNGSLVGLCTNQDLSCIGLGIVRSIDWAKQLLYILTPVLPGQLSNVTILVGGNIPLPLPLIFRGVLAESFPHLSTLPAASNDDNKGNTAVMPKRILGSEPMKSRNNLIRRGLAGGGNAK